MRNVYYKLLSIALLLAGCAVQTNQGMTMGQLNNAVGLSGNGNLVLVNRVGDYEIYQSSAVLNWKSQISQGNQIAKSILTPEKNVYYVLKGGALQQEVVGDANLNSFLAKLQPPAKPSAQQNLNNRPQQAVAGNFLIGLCDVSATPKKDPPVTSCSEDDLAMRPVWATTVTIYNPDSALLKNIAGVKGRGYEKNLALSNRATYQVLDANTVIMTVITSNGCMMPEKFTKSGSSFYKESLPASGNCGSNQIRAIQDSIKDGKTKALLIKG